jgi:hypothetical protein
VREIKKQFPERLTNASHAAGGSRMTVLLHRLRAQPAIKRTGTKRKETVVILYYSRHAITIR